MQPKVIEFGSSLALLCYVRFYKCISNFPSHKPPSTRSPHSTRICTWSHFFAFNYIINTFAMTLFHSHFHLHLKEHFSFHSNRHNFFLFFYQKLLMCRAVSLGQGYNAFASVELASMFDCFALNWSLHSEVMCDKLWRWSSVSSREFVCFPMKKKKR